MDKLIWWAFTAALAGLIYWWVALTPGTYAVGLSLAAWCLLALLWNLRPAWNRALIRWHLKNHPDCPVHRTYKEPLSGSSVKFNTYGIAAPQLKWPPARVEEGETVTSTATGPAAGYPSGSSSLPPRTTTGADSSTETLRTGASPPTISDSHINSG